MCYGEGFIRCPTCTHGRRSDSVSWYLKSDRHFKVTNTKEASSCLQKFFFFSPKNNCKTRKVFLEENVCAPTSLNRHILEIGCIYNFSFVCVLYVCVCVCVSVLRGNKISVACPIHIWQYGADKPFINILRPCMFLKRGSWSPKSNQSMSQQYICSKTLYDLSVTLKIRSRSQIVCKFGQNSSILLWDRVQTSHDPKSKPSCDLENDVKVSKV